MTCRDFCSGCCLSLISCLSCHCFLSERHRHVPLYHWWWLARWRTASSPDVVGSHRQTLETQKYTQTHSHSCASFIFPLGYNISNTVFQAVIIFLQGIWFHGTYSFLVPVGNITKMMISWMAKSDELIPVEDAANISKLKPETKRIFSSVQYEDLQAHIKVSTHWPSRSVSELKWLVQLNVCLLSTATSCVHS